MAQFRVPSVKDMTITLDSASGLTLTPSGLALRQPPTPARLRFNAYAPPARVDLEQHVIFGVSAMQAVEALGHRLMVDAKTLEQFVTLGNAAAHGLKSRFTHPGLSADGLGKHLGRMRNFRIEGDKAVGDLYLSETAARSPHGDLRAYVESLAAEDPEAFGMSVVVDGYGAWQLADGTEATDEEKPTSAIGNYPALRVTSAYAVDAVDEPAANRDGLFGAFSRTTNELAAEVYATLDRVPHAPALIDRFLDTGDLPGDFRQLADEYDIDPAKARVFAAQYLEHRRRHVAPARINLAARAAITESVPMNEDVSTGAAQQQAAPHPTGNKWLDALRQSTAAAIIQGSGLPPAIQARLSRGQYETPEAVAAAIEDARAELAAIQEANVVQMGNRPPRGGFHVSDAVDDAAGLVDFFFGVAGAPTPPANMRRFSDLYVALTGDAEFRGVFDPTRVMFASVTTATLSNLAADAMNKVIVERMAVLESFRWFEQLVQVVPNNGTLHDINLIALGGIGTLPTVAEGASYPELAIDDGNEAASFVKKGGYVGVTREAIKNSDIMQLQAIPRALAAAAIRTRSKAVANLFTMNSGVGPTLATDSKALFHADHGNIATTALGTDATAWRAARAAAFKQKELGSDAYMGVYPRYLLIPADLYDVALVILGYGEGMPTAYTPEALARGVYDPRPIPIVVPEWTDATDWAYMVDPAIWPVIHMSYSQAPGGGRHPAPELFSVTSETSGLMFTNDVLPIKVRDEFALGVSGYHGIGKRNVAG